MGKVHLHPQEARQMVNHLNQNQNPGTVFEPEQRKVLLCRLLVMPLFDGAFPILTCREVV